MRGNKIFEPLVALFSDLRLKSMAWRAARGLPFFWRIFDTAFPSFSKNCWEFRKIASPKCRDEYSNRIFRSVFAPPRKSVYRKIEKKKERKKNVVVTPRTRRGSGRRPVRRVAWGGVGQRSLRRSGVEGDRAPNPTARLNANARLFFLLKNLNVN